MHIFSFVVVTIYFKNNYYSSNSLQLIKGSHLHILILKPAFLEWDLGEPDNSGNGPEDCGVMWPLRNSQKGTWSSEQCQQSIHSICQKNKPANGKNEYTWKCLLLLYLAELINICYFVQVYTIWFYILIQNKYLLMIRFSFQ